MIKPMKVFCTPVDIPHELCNHSCGISTGVKTALQAKLDILQGTLDLMVLRTLSTLGSLHGYGIARRIEQVSGDRVILNQGTIYTSLVRLEQRGWIRSKWGVSENNRRAKFYSLTRTGQKQLAAETENWERIAAVMGRVLAWEGGNS
jgi:PadR family transcriptional regulator, regulatory protein PadR